MRAIIIDDKDARALLDKLELTNLQIRRDNSVLTLHEEQFLFDLHRRFHYEIVKWLQDQGANIIR